MSNTSEVNVVRIALILFVLAVLTIGLTGFAHGAVSKKHDNSLGVVQYQINPFTYVEGSINVSLVGTGVNLRLQPRSLLPFHARDFVLRLRQRRGEVRGQARADGIDV